MWQKPLPTKETLACMSGVQPHCQGTRNLYRGPENPNTQSRRETDKQASGQGRREGKENPSTGSPALTLKHPSPYSDSGFRGADSREFPRRAEHSKFSATASAGPRATLKYSVGANGEKVLEQEWPVRPLPDGSMGPGDLRIWSWVPRSDH